MKEEKPSLFEKGEPWEEAWRGMPEFVQEDQKPWKTLYVHFESREDMEAFARLVGQRIDFKTASIWHPEAEIVSRLKARYVEPATRAKKRPEEAAGKDGFAAQAESCVITSKAWAHLLNVGLNVGRRTLEEIDALVFEKFAVKTRKLTMRDYETALELVSEKKR